MSMELERQDLGGDWGGMLGGTLIYGTKVSFEEAQQLAPEADWSDYEAKHPNAVFLKNATLFFGSFVARAPVYVVHDAMALAGRSKGRIEIDLATSTSP